MTPDYTTVVGVDDKHLRQLEMVWPTWRKHKPSMLANPMLVFYDYRQVSALRVRAVCDHPRLTVLGWPCKPFEQYGDFPELGKFGGAQRYKMLAGFVHVPARHVMTKYWLKLDTDTIATGVDDWIDPSWFLGNPAIVAQPWSFTKPADQMMKLDEWAKNVPILRVLPSLDLEPLPGWSRVRHKRIISWCGFFQTNFTDLCAEFADRTVGQCQLPVPSQDGFMWYCAARLGRGIVRARMNKCGWVHRSSERNIRHAVEEAMR